MVDLCSDITTFANIQPPSSVSLDERANAARNKFAGRYVALKYKALNECLISEETFDTTFQSIFPVPKRNELHDALMAAPMFSETVISLIDKYLFEILTSSGHISDIRPNFLSHDFPTKMDLIDSYFGNLKQPSLGRLFKLLKLVHSEVKRKEKPAEIRQYLGAIEHSLAWLRFLILGQPEDEKKLYFVKSWVMTYSDASSQASGVPNNSIMALFMTRKYQYIFKHSIIGESDGYNPEQYNFTSYSINDPIPEFTERLIDFQSVPCTVIKDDGPGDRIFTVKVYETPLFFMDCVPSP